MVHKNYYQIKANDNKNLGLQLGEMFRNVTQKSLFKHSSNPKWRQRIDKSKPYLQITEKLFPQYIKEFKGYSEGARISFEDLWALSIENETNTDKCTTIVTNNGNLISHNEDWEARAQNSICILNKTIGNLTILELYYYNTLGGCSISVNSHGFVQAINTLTHTDEQTGVPRNVIARWMSETKNPNNDYKKFQKIQRQLGYNHVLADFDGNLWNIESTAKKSVLIKPNSPFVHTNHYLTELSRYETNDNSTGTKDRFVKAKQLIKNQMRIDELQEVVSDTSRGNELSIFNNRTIGRMIISFQEKLVKIWLLREKDLGWVDYKLDFIQQKS